MLGAASGAALVAPHSSAAWAASKFAGSSPNWGQLERTLKGSLLRPDADGYSEAIKIWNLRYASTRPTGVALVADAKDIATAIKWARDNQVEMVTRSGGHSYAGYSTTPGLVINLRGMTNVTVDQGSGILTTFGAALNRDVAAAGETHGRALPGGAIADVPATATAFVHRNDVWLQSFHCSWGLNDTKPVIDRLIAWQDDFYNAMKPFASDRAFQNFPDPQLENPLQAYYGENLKRLVEVKRTYDPNNVFTFPQSIKG